MADQKTPEQPSAVGLLAEREDGKRKWRPAAGLTVTVLVSLIILGALGTWQALKAGPKTRWLAQIEAGLSNPATGFSDLKKSRTAFDYRRVTLEGRFVHTDALRLSGTNLKGAPGYHLYGLMQSVSGEYMMASAGWIPLGETKRPTLPTEVQKWSGVFIPGARKAAFAFENNPKEGEWFWADLPEMAAHIEEKQPEIRVDRFLSYRLILDEGQLSAARGASVPLGGQVRVNIANNHFGYALTWYGLALALLCIYVLKGYERGDEREIKDQN